MKKCCWFGCLCGYGVTDLISECEVVVMSRHRDAFDEISGVAENELGDSLEKLVVYGSVAQGEETDESDLDVFAVVETDDQRRWLQQRAAEIGVDHGVLVSAIVKTEDNFERMKGSRFGREVLSTGEVNV